MHCFCQISYLDEKLPEIKFKDNTLSLKNKEAVIINDSKIINYFGNVIVINPIVEKQDEYIVWIVIVT